MKASEIDWSKAPKWATRHGVVGLCNSPVWLSQDQYTYVDGQQGGRIFYFGSGEGFSLDEIREVAERPSPWNGTGLPPVGTVCEYDAAVDAGPPAWHTVEIVYSSEWLLVVRCVSVPDGYDADVIGVEVSVPADEESESLFRPLRTPEQIAAEERERAADELCETIVAHYESPKMSEHYLGLARALYDAGYRKVE